MINLSPYSTTLEAFLAPEPSSVQGQANDSTIYYRTRLLQRVLGAFVFEGVPDTWDPDFCWPALFLGGWLGISDTPAGLVALPCSIIGQDLYYQPRSLEFVNPVLGSWRRTVGKDAVLLRLNPLLIGLWPMINRYSVMLANVDGSVNVNLINSRTAYFAQADNKADALGLKKVLDQIAAGRPAVFWRAKKKRDPLDNERPEIPFQHVPVKDAFIAEELLDARRVILEDFDREIGFALITKKERLITSEAQANSNEIYNNVACMLDTLNRGFGECNDMFGTDVSVRFRYDREGGGADESNTGRNPESGSGSI